MESADRSTASSNSQIQFGLHLGPPTVGPSIVNKNSWASAREQKQLGLQASATAKKQCHFSEVEININPSLDDASLGLPVPV